MKLVFVLLATVVVCALLSEADAAPQRKRRVIIIIVRRRPNRGRRDVLENAAELARQAASAPLPQNTVDEEHLRADADKFIYTGDALDEATIARLCTAVQREAETQSPGKTVQLDVEMLPVEQVNVDANDELTQVQGESELLHWRNN